MPLSEVKIKTMLTINVCAYREFHNTIDEPCENTLQKIPLNDAQLIIHLSC